MSDFREMARDLKAGEHFRLDVKKDKIELTEAGRTTIRYSNPPSGLDPRRNHLYFDRSQRMPTIAMGVTG